MNIIPIESRSRTQRRRFLDLPRRIYRRIPQWVPPLSGDARAMLDPIRHPFYRHSQAAFWLAEEGGEDVGRLAILDNRNYNTFNGTRTAFFTLFECVERRDVSSALFDAAFEWARGRGLDHVYGPKGLTALDGMGLLTRGFEHRPALGIPYNPPYYPALIEASGFTGTAEVVSGYLPGSFRLPERIHQLSERVQRRRGLRVARYRNRRDLRPLIPRLGRLYNASLAGTSGNVPLTEDEIQAIARQMLTFADPRLIKIVLKGEEPVGFLFAYPDISAALQRTAGRLFPLGWIDVLRELRTTKWVNINGIGIVEEYRGLGGTAILFSEMEKSVVEGGFQHADVVQIGVENLPMQREMRSLGIDFYKSHRMYERAL
jgi:GNAT superfamily N-acetyltransferase